ncbi:hypothetical protein HETIRDRAFT_429078 [Heterobasidion irregulare TC 32-1]|uniref:Uncharacterized protein n=1 Tax=Heterobasidion irregulare (strain TC 32-1) TaxID=747525 RepID=W4JYE9_HETIT|nr:uncharacterized protein HETIRDRAFT_429078 [Heterobasidion irregulare TC 32-1]ETW77881.1 hypothetical protein HETIRDRAFT_429078 [Heterobasidion irregulare TC 32-1]
MSHTSPSWSYPATPLGMCGNDGRGQVAMRSDGAFSAGGRLFIVGVYNPHTGANSMCTRWACAAVDALGTDFSRTGTVSRHRRVVGRHPSQQLGSITEIETEPAERQATGTKVKQSLHSAWELAGCGERPTDGAGVTCDKVAHQRCKRSLHAVGRGLDWPDPPPFPKRPACDLEEAIEAAPPTAFEDKPDRPRRARGYARGAQRQNRVAGCNLIQRGWAGDSHNSCPRRTAGAGAAGIGPAFAWRLHTWLDNRVSFFNFTMGWESSGAFRCLGSGVVKMMTRLALLKRHTGQVRHSKGVDKHRTSIGSHATERKTPYVRPQVSKAVRPNKAYGTVVLRIHRHQRRERDGDVKTVEAARSAASQRCFPSAETDARLEPMGGFPAYPYIWYACKRSVPARGAPRGGAVVTFYLSVSACKRAEGKEQH